MSRLLYFDLIHLPFLESEPSDVLNLIDQIRHSVETGQMEEEYIKRALEECTHFEHRVHREWTPFAYRLELLI